jgi:hypothetical protein
METEGGKQQKSQQKSQKKSAPKQQRRKQFVQTDIPTTQETYRKEMKYFFSHRINNSNASNDTTYGIVERCRCSLNQQSFYINLI